MNKLIPIFSFFLTTVCLFCGPSFALAQEELFQFPSGPATWTVTCEKKTAVGKKQGSATPAEEDKPMAQGASTGEISPKKIEVAQGESIARSVIQFSNGRTQELWSVPRLGVMLTEDPSGQAFVTRETLVYGDPFSPSNFNWIKKDSVVGEKLVQFDGLECKHYKGFILSPVVVGVGKPKEIPCEAWIDAKTLRPVALLRGNLLGKFVFGEPAGDLKIPKKFQERLDYYRITMGFPPEKKP